MMLFALHYASHKTELYIVVYLPQAQTDKRLECVLAFATETYDACQDGFIYKHINVFK